MAQWLPHIRKQKLVRSANILFKTRRGNRTKVHDIRGATPTQTADNAISTQSFISYYHINLKILRAISHSHALSA